MPPSRPVVREAVPWPPRTIARPYRLVFSSAFVFPADTSFKNLFTSVVFTSFTRREPRRGMMCRSTLPLSVKSVDGFFG